MQVVEATAARKAKMQAERDEELSRLFRPQISKASRRMVDRDRSPTHFVDEDGNPREAMPTFEELYR